MGFVVIGRNEAARLAACLASIPRHLGPVVYVDSGSSDGSLEIAREAGVECVALDAGSRLSAASARNAGFAIIRARKPDLATVHFVDGDCVLEADWPEKALALLEAEPGIVAVCGSRREAFPDASPYNRLCEIEWRLPAAGESMAFGGEVAIRVAAFMEAGGYAPEVIAAEDDELALRLRADGGRIWRLEDTSSRHDAAIENLSGWWRRAVRCGYGYAQVGALHGGPPARAFDSDRRRTLLWGGGLPVFAFGLAAATGGISLTFLLLYVVQARRLARKVRSLGITRDVGLWSTACVAAQPANCLGMLTYYARDRLGLGPRIIEYKRAVRSGSAGRDGRVVATPARKPPTNPRRP